DYAPHIRVTDSSSWRFAQDDRRQVLRRHKLGLSSLHASRRINKKLTVCTTSAAAVARAKDCMPPRCGKEIDNVMRNVAAVKRPAVTPFRACTANATP